MTTTAPLVEPRDTLNTLVARYPAVLPVLQRYGLDTCCGGSLSLAVAAEHHQLDLVELLAAIRAELEPQGRRA